MSHISFFTLFRAVNLRANTHPAKSLAIKSEKLDKSVRIHFAHINL